MNNFYSEVEHLIKRNEINKKARLLQDNSENLKTYWNIGKLIVEAQGGEKRAKYGNTLIKKWSEKLIMIYGKGYDYTNLSRFRQFYLSFPILGPVAQVSWTNIVKILPIKDENKRNYYINLCIEKNLSKRDLIKEIKNESYERLLKKPDKIDIIENKQNSYSIKDYIKNPIIIEIDSNDKVLKEKDLQLIILSKLKNFFSELGQGYMFAGNEYKLKYGNKFYYIDILLFNVEFNSYVVVELKLRELRKEDKAQIEFYMNIIDNTLKRDFHNKTIGILVTKEQDKFIATFVSEDNIIPITYILKDRDEYICE